MDVRCKDRNKNNSAPKVSRKTFGALPVFHPAIQRGHSHYSFNDSEVSSFRASSTALTDTAT